MQCSAGPRRPALLPLPPSLSAPAQPLTHQPLTPQPTPQQAHYDFVEIMACPGGCIGGGGQPKARTPDAVARRLAAIYSIDERAAVRASHHNPEVQALYREVLGHPGSRLAHELLHTRYSDRSRQGGGAGGGGGEGEERP